MNINATFLIFFISCNCIIGQANLTPTATEALVSFVFTNPLNQKVVPNKEFSIESISTQETFELTTNQEGRAAILLPTKDDYVVHLPNWENFATLEIPKGEFQKHHIPVPFYELPKAGSDVVIEIPVQIMLLKANGLPNETTEKLTVKSGKTRQVYTLKTDKNGVAELKLPINGDYVLSLEQAPHYYKFTIPNRPYAAWQEQIVFERKKGLEKYPSIKKALFNFIFEDLDNKRCANERFWIQSLTSNKRYEGTTNQQGIAQILVPLDDTYSLNEMNNPDFERKTVALEAGKDLIIETIMYQAPSTPQQQARKEAQNKAAKARDKAAQLAAQKMTQRLDSLKKISEDKALDAIVRNDLPIPIKKKTFRIRKAVIAKVEIYEKQLVVNPDFFKEKQKPILATLNRFKENWKGKVIVTDVTESMNPYLEEVLVWHALNLRQGNGAAKYIFFNDGDNKTAGSKVIGETGGLYDCQGNYDDLPLVVQTMQLAIQSGLGGGEPPENDLEAVLKGQGQKANAEEVILIADSYSRVRDMALLSQIKVPVRVILCGAEEKNTYYQSMRSDINEQYLTIAHRTGGSLHTLKSDIWNLSEKKEGEVVQIGQSKYVLKNRQFIKLN